MQEWSNNIGRQILVLNVEQVSMTICPLKFLHGLTWDRTWISLLIARAIAGSYGVRYETVSLFDDHFTVRG